MTVSISHRIGKEHAFQRREHRPSASLECAETEQADDAVTTELSLREKSRHRIWRAVSWMLLVNVVGFWLMTCITVFASTTAM